MIELKIQIIEIGISVLFGFILSFLYKLNYKYIYFSSYLYRIVINVLFILNVFLLYFIILKKYCYGYVHIYYVILLLISFCLSSKCKLSFFKLNKKK